MFLGCFFVPIPFSVNEFNNIDPHFKCSRCGWCCQHLIYGYSGSKYQTKQKLEWMEARGIIIKGNKLIVPSNCKFLYWQINSGKTIAACELQEMGKPQICVRAGCTKI